MNQPRTGSALLVSTFLIVLLLGLSLSLTELSTSNYGASERRKDAVSLTVATESIANLALNNLQNLPDLDSQLELQKTRDAEALTDDVVSAAGGVAGGTDPLNGVIPAAWWKYAGTVRVPIYGIDQDQDVYQISAVGAVGGPVTLFNADGSTNPLTWADRFRRRRVEALFTPFPSTSFRQALFAKKGYEYMGNATTDSWDSNSGMVGYGSTATGNRGDLSSEGDIVVQKPGNVQGDVNANITLPLPAFTYNPPGTASLLGGGAAVTGAGPLATGSYRCSSLALTANNAITFAPGATVKIYVDGPISLKGDWTMPPGVTLQIFQNNYDSSLGDTTINGNITVGNAINPAAFQFYTLYDGKIPDADNQKAFDFKLNGTASFGGVLFAPFATFALNGTFDYYGSLIADSFKDTTDMGKVNGSFAFHYDESLAGMKIPFPPSLVIVGWHSFTLGQSEWRDQAAGIRWDAP